MKATNLEVRPIPNSAVFCVEEKEGHVEVTSKIIRQCPEEAKPSEEVYRIEDRCWRSESGASFSDILQSLSTIIPDLIKPD